MADKQKIINIAVIAHVDAGKSTLVDALLAQSHVFRDNEQIVDCVMDSDAIERERGITIYSKNCSIMYKDYKINIVDTPGHADFSSEVERIMKTVDTVILLVDSSEGPMPQTRFVLSKSLAQGINPILFINKIDKKDARIDEVVDEVYELFMDLEANDDQLDFPILYGIARQGIAVNDPSDVEGIQIGEGETKIRKSPKGYGGLNIEPLLECITKHCDPYPDTDDEPLQLQVSTLAYDDYIGRLGIGRITRGTIKEAQMVSVTRGDGSVTKNKINQIFVYRGLSRTVTPQAGSGDIVVVSGIPDISIGDTICDPDHPESLGTISIEEPTLSMNFMVNTSPFAGKVGKYVTSRHIKDRLEKELEVNVGLLVEPTDTTDSFKVSGRGELHLSILIENMRREGYELAVSKPEVVIKRGPDGEKLEPVEEVVVSVPDEYTGPVISKSARFSMASSSGCGRTPTSLPSCCPSWKTMMVGMLITPKRWASSGCSSTSTFATITLSAYWAAISSTMGAIMRQGPHQVAQKSTSTGASPAMSLSKASSEPIWITFSFAIVFLLF